ncbi:hypothetical protein ACX4Y9_05850 [Aerococcus loyolae]
MVTIFFRISVVHTSCFDQWGFAILTVVNLTSCDRFLALIGFSCWGSWVELDGCDTIFALLYNWNKSLAVCTVLAFFALGTLSTCCAGRASITFFTLFAIFYDTFSDWLLSLICCAVCLGWVEFNGGLFVRLIALDNWNVRLAVCTIFTLLTLGAGCTGFTLFAVFYDTFSDRFLGLVGCAIGISWVEFDGRLFAGLIAFNNWNVGLAVDTIFTLLTLGTGRTSFTLFTLRALDAWVAFFTFSPVFNLTGCDRLLVFIRRAIFFGWVELDMGNTISPFFNNGNIGLAVSTRSTIFNFASGWRPVFRLTLGIVVTWRYGDDNPIVSVITTNINQWA